MTVLFSLRARFGRTPWKATRVRTVRRGPKKPGCSTRLTKYRPTEVLPGVDVLQTRSRAVGLKVGRKNGKFRT